MRFRSFLLAAGLFCASAPGLASPEVSFLSGAFRNAVYKSNDSTSFSTTQFGAGLRYADRIDGPWYWYAEGALELINYSKSAAPIVPSNTANLGLGGGIRYYFEKLSDRVEPYALASGSFRSEQIATPAANGYTETDKNGLYYRADFGIRISLQKEFFVDFEVPLFDSALFATEKDIQADFSGEGTKSSSEKQRIELFAKSTGSFNGMNVALGYRF
ncbi:MAG: outer membrane beta-barrel protein [Proteobacteria bacterium]|nr:outer membrane beta-barrel protein [Pseudomonadota bacterium]